MSDCDVPLVTGMVSPWLNASGLRGYHSSSEEVTQSPHRPWFGALGTAYAPVLGMLAQVLALWGVLLEVRALGGLAQQLWDTLFGPGILTPDRSLSCLPSLPVHLHSHPDKHNHPLPMGERKEALHQVHLISVYLWSRPLFHLLPQFGHTGGPLISLPHGRTW